MPQTNPSTPALLSKNTADVDLAKHAAAGDAAAFEAIMRRHNRLLFRTARSILKSDSEAEDALQEAYLCAWRALAGFRSEAQLSTWLVRIVANEALGRLRRKEAPVIPLDATMNVFDFESPGAIADDPELRPDRTAAQAELRTLMEARIDRLPEAFRIVFMLRAVEEMSVEEVAQALAIPEATVRTRYFRARSLLREQLASDVDLALGDAFAFDGARCNRIVATVLTKARAIPN
ncbi:MAG: RNA polymerase sigma factor [Proteobacteria bacterium]|nr:RNA polymerase sigma factor [Pseudomonadota bacterium]